MLFNAINIDELIEEISPYCVYCINVRPDTFLSVLKSFNCIYYTAEDDYIDKYHKAIAESGNEQRTIRIFNPVQFMLNNHEIADLVIIGETPLTPVSCYDFVVVGGKIIYEAGSCDPDTLERYKKTDNPPPEEREPSSDNSN